LIGNANYILMLRERINMEKISAFNLAGIPEAFGTTLLVLFLILSLVPYFSGSDFGIFKIPVLAGTTKRKSKYLGPILLAITLIFHIPFFNSVSTNNVVLKNPFGESQILLDGHEILLAKRNFDKLSDTKSTHNFPKYLFQIPKTKDSHNLKSELIDTLEYAKHLDKNTGWVSLQNQIKKNPVLLNSKVFRIYEDKPLNIRVDRESYEGVKASPEKYKAAKEFVGNPFEGIKDVIGEGEINIEENQDSNAAEDLENMEIEELQNTMKEFLTEEIGERSFTVFNELSIVIIDKKEFELQAIAINGGTEIQASPFYYLLSFGSILPYFNVQSVTDISVSSDSKVWAFYAERKLNNVYVNNEMTSVMHTDFYRIYAINSDYIYQITLSYTPSIDTPRKTWNELVRVLKELRIVNE